MPSGHYADVIERLKPGAATAGDIVHIDGRVLGRHDGIIHYTVGQRRGIGVAVGEPLYVVHLDPAGAARHRRPARGAGDAAAASARGQLARRRAARRAAAGGHARYTRASARRGRRCRRICSRGDGEIFVDLADGEAGVAPGPGLRLLRGRRRRGARARRRLHRARRAGRGGGAGAPPAGRTRGRASYSLSRQGR